MPNQTKTIKFERPQMLVWLLLPLGGLIIATHYFFAKPEQQVLGITTEKQIPITTQESGQKLYQKFNSFKWNGGGVVSIVFTGSQKNQYEIAYPEISSRNLSASITVPTNSIGQEGQMGWLNIELLQYRGWEIISQSRDQICDLNKLKDQSILDSEIQGSKDDLSKIGIIANAYISPCGVDSPQIEKTIKTNYQASLRFDIVSNSLPIVNRYNLAARQVNNTVNFSDIQTWIDKAIKTNSWLVIVFPSIGDQNNTSNVSGDLLNKTLNEIVKSNIQVALPGEILKYDQE